MGKKIYTDTLQTTLVIIKPDGLAFQKQILKKFYRLGFKILAKKYIQFSPEQAAEFYHEYEKRQYFSLLILTLTKGTSMALILTKENILIETVIMLTPHWQKTNIEKQRTLNICFHCINKNFGNCNLDYKNFVHCSVGPVNAKRELNYVFPNFLVEQPGQPELNPLCNRAFINVFLDGLFFVTENNTDDPITKLANFLLDNNKNLPIVEYANKKPEYPCRQAECASEIRKSESSNFNIDCASSDLDVHSTGSNNTCLCYTCSTSSHNTECSIESEISNKTGDEERNVLFFKKCVEVSKIEPEEEPKPEVKLKKTAPKKRHCK